MKVGDYVRSSWGTISRIKKYEHDEDGTGFSILIENECFGTHYENKSQFDNDYKSSSNIIDLIEVGDYVNGSKVIRIEESSYVEDNKKLMVTCEGSDNYNSYFEEEIKLIVTKEQFSQREYRIGE